MKTKHIFYSMVLPALFAACTAEEVVENSNVALNDGELLNPITFTVDGKVESRLLWDATADGVGNWKWGEEGDMFSAFLVNTGVTAGVQDAVTDKLLTNYVYSSEDGVHYNTTSAMTEGTYWFYAPGDENKRDNSLIKFELPIAQPANHYYSDAAQVFFTPLYQLAKNDAPEALGLELTNWFGRAVFPIKNNTGVDLSVKQVILELENNKKWTVAGEISPVALSEAELAYKFENGEKMSVVADETLAELKARLQAANDVVVEKEESSTLILNLGSAGVSVPNGGEHTFTMLVPATEEGVSCNITFVTTEGLVKVNSYNNSNYTKTGKQFKHNGIMPMFGMKASGDFKTYTIVEEDLDTSDATYYVATYSDMMNLINTVNGDMKVYNIGDWAVDARMASAIKNSDSDVTFVQPIDITDETAVVELTKINFDEVTVTEGTSVEFGNNTSAETLNVEAGATAEINALGTSKSITDIINAGELTVDAAAEVVNVETTGTLTLVGTNDVKINVKAGSVGYAEIENSDIEQIFGAGYLTITPTDLDNDGENEKVEIKVGENAMFNVNKVYEIPDNAKVTNYGRIKLNNKLTVEGELDNYGKVYTTKNYQMVISGSATNNAGATISANTVVDVDAEVENAGVMENVNNCGEIKTTGTGSACVTTLDSTGSNSGRINNTAGCKVNLNGKTHEVYYLAEDKTNADLETIDFKKFNINILRIKGSLTMNKAFSTDADVVEGLSSLTTLEVENDAIIYINENNIAANFTTIKLLGNATVQGWDQTNSVLTLAGTTSLVATKKNVDTATGAGYKISVKNVKISGNVTTSAIEETGTLAAYENVLTEYVDTNVAWGFQ